MWALIRIVGIYLGIGILIAKVAQWLNRLSNIDSDTDEYVWVTLFWPLVLPIAVLTLIYDGLKRLFE